MEHYSKLFTADATQIILEELQLPENQLLFVKKYNSYFGAKTRRADFVKYWSDTFDKTPEKGIIAAITKTEKLDMNELLMKVIAAGYTNNHYIFAFSKYDVLDTFWKMVMNYLGGETDSEVDLKYLVERIFITYLANELNNKLPDRFKNYYLKQSDNVQIFIDRFADSNKYQQYYDNCSSTVWRDLNLNTVLKHEPAMILTKISIFEEINHLILAKLVAKFDGKRITDYEQLLEIIDQMLDHTRNNFNGGTEPEYKFLRYAAELLNLRVPMVDDWQDELNDYLDNSYKIDTIYRKSLLAYTNIIDTDNYIDIKKTIDRYYGNILLDSSVKQWNETFDLKEVPAQLKQERFYHNYVRDVRERVVVIFSDALRYEVAKELVEATEKAIDEIKQAVQVLRTNGITHIIITADHGFIYQEKPIEDKDKIDLQGQNYEGNAHLRYLITPSQISVMGVKNTTMGVSLNNDDPTNVYYPVSPNEFVARSGSKNYVHGGSSIQEILIPVLDIKATSRRSIAQPAEIKLAATTFRINNLKMNLLFNQTAPISDTVLPAEYHAYFTDEDGNLISNNIIIQANRTGSAADRTIAITITMQDTQYSLDKKYYLVIEREGSAEEPKRFEYSMDLIN